MKITVTTLNDEIFVLDVSEDLELENFKAFCEIESGFPASDITLNFNGTPLLDDKKTLKELGVQDGDVVVLLHMMQAPSNLSDDDSSQGITPLCLFSFIKLHCHVIRDNAIMVVVTRSSYVHTGSKQTFYIKNICR